MFPVYRHSPYQRNQMPLPTYYHPNWEAIPPQMKEEPPSSSCTHESWPHNYGYPMPMQCHNCFSHGPQAAYYDFRPPCSHLPPPPPPPAYHHYCGDYPPYPQSFYPMYYNPPPHYSVDLPRYDYDKSAPKDQFHCCGCPNHSCHGKERNNVKIEEQEPDVDLETKRGERMLPSGLNNHSYPIVWVPSGFTMNKEQPRRLVENEVNDQKGFSQMPKRSVKSEPQDINDTQLGKKSQGNVQENRDPNLGYRWFPLDVNSIKQLMEGADVRGTHNQEKRSGDEKKAQDVENKDQNKQLSYPIIWVPYDKLLKDDSENRVEKMPGGKVDDGSAPISNFSPGIIQDGGNTEEGKERIKTEHGDEKTGKLEVEKSKSVRTIPVKQLDESAPKLTKKEEEHKPSSSTKKPKLPPICLRVDPPKKKNGNGSSRSPSPPGDKKGRENDVSQGEIKVKDIEEKAHPENKIEVSHGMSDIGGIETNAVEHNNSSNSQVSQTSELNGVEIKTVEHDKSSKLGDAKCGGEKGQERELQAEKGGKVEPVSMKKRRAMSELEAAVTIQSAYRGYDVRRWDPLKKLKLMAEVREEAMQVKKNIEDLESCENVKDEKVKTIIGETIMKLLLKLDTIQGLHESIRDVRRSLAKELNFFQEKLDSIVSQKSILPSQNTSIVQPAEASPKDPLVETSEGTIETTKYPSETSNLDEVTNTNDSEGDSNVSSANQHLPCDDEVCGSECKGTEQSFSMNTDPPKEAQGEFSTSRNGDTSVVVDTTMQSHSLVENKVQEAYVSSEKPQDVIETSPIENDLVRGNDGQNISQLLESPEQAHEQSARPIVVEDNAKQEIDTTKIEDWEVNILSELPLEVVGEDNNGMLLSETVVESSERIENQEAEVLFELPREVAENEKEMPLAELLVESSNNSEDFEGDILSELPREVVSEKDVSVAELFGEDKVHEIDNLNGNDEKLAEVDPSGNLKEDHKLDVSVKGIQIGMEDVAIDNSANSEIPIVEEEVSKPQESTGERGAQFSEKENEGEEMKDSVDMSIPEFSSKMQTIADPDLGENNDVKEAENLHREISNLEHSFTTPLDDKVPEPLADVQQTESEIPDLSSGTFVTEPIVQKSESQQEAQQFSQDQDSGIPVQNEVNVEEKIKEENEKLRKLLEQLLKSEKEQQELICSLSGKVKDMEKKLAKRKKQATKHPRVAVSRSSCRKPANGSPRHRPMGAAS